MSWRVPPGLTDVEQPDAKLPADEAVIWILAPGVDPAAVPALCDHLAERVRRRRATRVVCDVGGITVPDAGTLATLARLQLTARRLGCRVELHRVQPALRELIRFAGLDDVLPARSGSGVESGGQAEQREQPGGVQEVADPLDPAG